MPSSSASSALASSSSVDRYARQPVQHVHQRVRRSQALNSQSSGGRSIRNPAAARLRPPPPRRPRRRPDRRRGPAPAPRAPTARSRRPGRRARRRPSAPRRTLERVAQAQAPVSASLASDGRYLLPMRLATFNILHGRGPSDGLVDLDRLAAAVRSLDADILALQEVDRDQPRSHLADLTAVAAEAMGAVTHRFAAALAGTPGATWIAASERGRPGHGVLRGRAALALPRAVLAGPAPAPDPGALPAVSADPAQGRRGSRGAAGGGHRPSRHPRRPRSWSPTPTCRSCPAGAAGSSTGSDGTCRRSRVRCC